MKIWTNHEHARLLKLIEEGMTNRQIAEAIGRPYTSVRARIHLYGLRGGPNLAAPKEKAPISRAELIEWYSLGWRVDSFDSDRCIMIWPHATGPVLPSREIVA
jgi:hypothetical protein